MKSRFLAPFQTFSLLLCLLSWGGASSLWSAELSGPSRVQYLERLLAALRSSPEAEFKRLSQETENAFTKLCRSSDPSLALSCAFESAEKTCRAAADPSSCLLIMDALIVERLNAHRFVSARERYEMMSRGSHHKEALAQTLQYRYGSLVQSFSLSTAAGCVPADLSCIARSLEEFCQNEARVGRLSYQSCASVVSIYIGTRTRTSR